MTSDSVSPQVSSAPQPVAPAWHTVILLLAFLGLSLLSARSHSLSPLTRGYGRAAGYVVVMGFEWLLVAFIWWGLRLKNLRLGDLVGGSWQQAKHVLRDLGIAGVFLIAANLILGILGYLLKAGPNQALREVFPRGNTEIAVYLLLTLTAGICEEIIFRGYLQRQFAALARSAAGGLVLQGIVFGVAHGYQGAKFMLIISVFGCTFGLLAAWRRSLRPGMLAHFLQDAVLGLLGSHLVR
jgi:membrane protease YdiL (CAAX protease family)